MGVTLSEKPNPDGWSLIPIARRVIPNKMQGVLAYYAACQIRKAGGNLSVQYKTKHEATFGRLYATPPGAQALSRPARYILFGGDHFEIDMEGAHFAIALSIIQCHQRRQERSVTLSSHLSCVATARQWILDALRGTPIENSFPGFHKHVWILATNSGFQVAKNFIIRHNIVVHHEVISLIGEFCSAFQSALRQLPTMPEHPRVNDRNRVYFQLELLEARFMQHFMHRLIQIEPMNSMVLIHDGVWIFPRPTNGAVDDAAQFASIATGLEKIRVKITPLLPEYLRIKQAVLHAAGQDPSAPPNFCRIGKRWHTLLVMNGGSTSMSPKLALSGNRCNKVSSTCPIRMLPPVARGRIQSFL